MRGDPPLPGTGTVTGSVSTPHARGSTSHSAGRGKRVSVYPACAGIHPALKISRGCVRGLPRMRGDPPLWYVSMLGLKLSTPHARGSTHLF